MVRILAPLVFAASIPAQLVQGDSPVVSVRFYGESQCPYCRKFVEEVWSDIWADKELQQYVDYNFVPWGNAYFSTDMCGSGPYNSNERACFYKHCITAEDPAEDACFGGEPIYQHSEKEGQVDIYESCILKHNGLDEAVAFTYCAEGSIMDDSSMTAEDLLKHCVPSGVDPSKVQDCLDKEGRALEIENAKKTPPHPGVPFVVVDGEPLQDPFGTKKAICRKLSNQGITLKTCASGASLPRQSVSLSM